MKYMSIKQIRELTGKSYSAVVRALKAHKVKTEKGGTKGLRIKEKDAMAFIALQWPECLKGAK